MRTDWIAFLICYLHSKRWSLLNWPTTMSGTKVKFFWWDFTSCTNRDCLHTTNNKVKLVANLLLKAIISSLLEFYEIVSQNIYDWIAVMRELFYDSRCLRQGHLDIYTLERTWELFLCVSKHKCSRFDIKQANVIKLPDKTRDGWTMFIE